MAISQTRLAMSGSASNVTNYDTASITPTGGKVLIVGVLSREATGSPNDCVITGCNMTWHTDKTTIFNSVFKLHLCWGTGSSPTAGALNIAFNGQTQTGAAWVVTELTGADTQSPIVQSKVATSDASNVASIAVTLDSAFASASNATLGWAGNESGSGVGMAVGSGFTEVGETGFYESGNGLMEFKDTNDTGIDAARDSGTGAMAIIGAELRADSSNVIIMMV